MIRAGLRNFAASLRQSSLSEPNQDLLMALGGEQMISGERVSVSNSLAIADVFTAVDLICSTIATLPLRVFRQIGALVEEQPDHRTTRMLEQPNPAMPAHLFWPTIAGYKLLWGNYFIEKLRDDSGLVAELWPLHPSTVEVQWNEAIRQKRFKVWDGNGGFRMLGEDRVLHGFGFSVDGLNGLSPIQQVRQQLGLVKARERFEGELYYNKPFLTGVIETDKRITNTVKLREDWSAIYGGGDRGPYAKSSRHSVGVLEEGAHYNQLTAPMADMQFVESQQMSKRAIAALFHIPPAYLGGSTGDSLTYQTVESNQIQFARMAITPNTVNIQKTLGADSGIFPFSSWYPEFVLEGLLRGDSKARADFYKVMHEIKAMTSDEIRGLENLPPLTKGQEDSFAPSVIAPTLEAEDAA